MVTNLSEEISFLIRDRRFNVILDNDRIRYEKFFQFRRNRSVAKGIIIKKIKEVMECFFNCDDIVDVRLKAQEFYEIVIIFRDVYNVYYVFFDDEFEI